MKGPIPSRKPGQSLVEFALAAVLLLTMIMGAVDFGLVYYTLVMMRNSVAEGGYYASQHPRDTQGVKEQIKHELQLTPPVTNADIQVVCNPSPPGDEQTTVRITYDHPLLFSVVIPNATISLHAETSVPQLGGC